MCTFTEGNATNLNITDTKYDVTNMTSEYLTCEFSCDDGYMLPYKVHRIYSCIDEKWDIDNFPGACIGMRVIICTYTLPFFNRVVHFNNVFVLFVICIDCYKFPILNCNLFLQNVPSIFLLL